MRAVEHRVSHSHKQICFFTLLTKLPNHIRQRIRVTGVVQGVGFRPYVWRRAHEFGLAGFIHNNSCGVTIEIQGGAAAVAQFVACFADGLPVLAKIDSIQVEAIPLAGATDFEIVDSVPDPGQSTPISAEISVCADCLLEMSSPGDRRYRYPFINCTNCGPRFTILEDLPYDRASTTMRSFTMCELCLQEYEDPGDRRFHAQPNACHDCGPRVWFVESAQRAADFTSYRGANAPVGDAAIGAFQTAIQAGKIVAVKGIGGFHLVCDATNDSAITKLRERKGRVDKPFAIMVRDVQVCKSFAAVSDTEQGLLESKERPIVLLRKRVLLDSSKDSLSDFIAPGQNFIGVMLPYSPLHVLLLEGCSRLVMTSGNLTEEPIVRENVEAKNRLSGIADCFLLHDRDINVVCDDSVVRCVDNGLLPIRRSRGYAPLPVKLNTAGPSVLAVGGEIKATFCATKNDYAYMSQHIGDMGNLETFEAMRRSVDHFLRLYRICPQAIAADLHPDYLSTNLAKEFASTLNVACIQVQHHHAHIASLLAEHALPADRSLIGCCFDGTGFGTDGAIWGGEFMIADASGFDRFAQLKYVPMPGGDASIYRPYRMALSHLFAAGADWHELLPSANACGETELEILRQQLKKNVNCIPTSSMGRLFDAIASLIGVRQWVNYEAQAAMELEALAAKCIDDNLVRSKTYDFRFENSALTEINPQPLIREICRDVVGGVEKEIIAARFHVSIAKLVADVCVAKREESSINQVGLSGGVFQNVLLLELTTAKLLENHFEVFCHRQVPPNDGGIALGQALIAQKYLSEQSS